MLQSIYKYTLILCCLLFILPKYSRAQAFYDSQSKTHIIGLPAFVLEAITLSEGTLQEKEFWCWAASAQAILATMGIEKSQPEIVKAIMGSVINEVATAEQVLQAVDGHEDIINGQRVRTQATFLNSFESIINDLKESRPLIVGFEGHAYVLTGAEYKQDSEGKITILKVVLRDPWPDNQHRQEWDFVNFLIRDPIIIRIDLDYI